MLNTEVFVAMTAAALHTSRLRLATGVEFGTCMRPGRKLAATPPALCVGRRFWMCAAAWRGVRQSTCEGGGGAKAAMTLHAMVEQHEFGSPPRQPLPAHLQPLLDRYREIYHQYVPEDARYLRDHHGHLMYLRPDEEELCTAELIRATTWTASCEELRERLQELPRLGYSHVAVNFGSGAPSGWKTGRICVQYLERVVLSSARCGVASP